METTLTTAQGQVLRLEHENEFLVCHFDFFIGVDFLPGIMINCNSFLTSVGGS